MNRIPLVIAACLTTALAAESSGQTFTAIPNSFSAMDISPDGRWIVGSASGGPYRYDTQTGAMLFLPGGFDATGVSDDGQIIVGCMPDPEDGVEVAGMWTEGTGWVSLGYLPDALNCPSRSNAYEVSGDGTVVTGLSWDGCSGRAFVWTQATGMLECEALANGNNRASVISSDGKVIGGFAQGSFSRTPAMWDAVTTEGTLFDPPNGDVLGEVYGIADDGLTLLLEWDGEASTWTQGGGVQTIGAGSLIATWTGIPCDIADQSGAIVGFDIFFTSRRAWIKPANENQLVLLTEYFEDEGGTLPAGQSLEVATRVSANGKTIIGHTAFDTAWILTFPSCSGDTNGDDIVDVTDMLQVLADWGPCAGCSGDLNGDDIVDVTDLLLLLGVWGPCT